MRSEQDDAVGKFSRWVRPHLALLRRAAFPLWGAAVAACLLSAALAGCPGEQFGEVGTATCLVCHDGRVAPDVSGFPQSPHADEGCEECHGPGYLHVRNAGEGGAFIIRYEGDAAKQIALCSDCHEEQVAGYQSGFHGANGYATCTDCHDVHAQDTTPATSCRVCHSHEATSFSQSSHAVVGGLSCGDCHSLHAAPPANLTAICQTCHAAEVDDFQQSVHGIGGGATCLDCHPVHEPPSLWPSYTDNDVCLQCHAALGFNTDDKIEEHTYHDVDPERTGASRCVPCHLPPLQREDQENGPHSHTFAPFPPITSNEAADSGVTPTPPNSCAGITGCHDGTVRTAPAFDVDDPDMNTMLQIIYDTRYGD